MISIYECVRNVLHDILVSDVMNMCMHTLPVLDIMLRLCCFTQARLIADNAYQYYQDNLLPDKLYCYMYSFIKVVDAAIVLLFVLYSYCVCITLLHLSYV